MFIVAIVVATLVAMFVGALWYSPVLFGDVWMREMGIKKKDMENMEGVWKLYAAHLVLLLVQFSILAHVIKAFEITDFYMLGKYAIVAWFTLMAIPIAGWMIWEKKSFNIFVINSLHQLASLLVGLLVLLAVITF